MKNIRISKIKTIASGALLSLAFGVLSLAATAQDQTHHAQKEKPAKDFVIGKKGEVHFYTQVKAGETVLKPGMYQVQHVEEGGEHVIVFREMSMAAGYRMGNTPVAKEAARVKCRVEPVTKKVSNTKITLRTNDKGEKEIATVQVAGEAFKHLI
jgi:hypothetical protein